MNAATKRSSDLLPVPIGAVIAGKYVVGRVIASGGMGIVAEAKHEALDQRVAIKFLLPEVAEHEEGVQRFLREARAAAKIESDHIVRVFDVGTHDGIPYMVMEYLEGVDLDGYIKQSGSLPVNEAVTFIVEALDGLAQAHALGIVHRDLKPGNLFLVERSDRTRSRRVKILDFGISKVMPDGARVDLTLTSTKSLLGSPGYMSPEQVRSTKNVDARTDVWAMGVIFYELLTGEAAFTGESVGDVFAKIREEPLAPIREKRPDVPVELERVIMQCIERDKSRRYADANALLEALAPFASSALPHDPSAAKSAPHPRVTDASASAATIAAPLAPAGSDKPNTFVTWSGEGGRQAMRWPTKAAIAIAICLVACAVWFLRGSTGGVTANLATSGAPSSTEPKAATAPTSSIEVRPAEIAASASPPAVVESSIPSASMPPAPPAKRFAPAPTAASPHPALPKKKDDLGI